MTRPTVEQAIEAAKELRKWYGEAAEPGEFPNHPIVVLLDYTQADRWRFGWYVTDFGDILGMVGPPESFDGMQRHFATADEALAAAGTKYDTQTAHHLEQQFKIMGVL